MLKEYLIGRVAEAKAVQAKLPGIKEDEVGPLLSLHSNAILASPVVEFAWD